MTAPVAWGTSNAGRPQTRCHTATAPSSRQATAAVAACAPREPAVGRIRSSTAAAACSTASETTPNPNVAPSACPVEPGTPLSRFAADGSPMNATSARTPPPALPRTEHRASLGDS